MADAPAAPPKPRIGAKPKLTPEVQAAICERIAAAATLTDAAHIVDLDPSTVQRWIAKGVAQKRGIYRAFFNAVEKAKAQRRTALKAQIRVHARTHWQAAQALGAITDPGEFVPQVRVHVEGQLDQALDRLQAEFLNEPEIYERCLRAVTGIGGPAASSDVVDGEVVQALPERSTA